MPTAGKASASSRYSIQLSIALARIEALGEIPREEEVERVRDLIAMRVRAWLATREAAEADPSMRTAIQHENHLLSQGDADLDNLNYNVSRLREQLEKWSIAIV